jgi:two-component system, OmpR family, sensor histidine kinase KdpD
MPTRARPELAYAAAVAAAGIATLVGLALDPFMSVAGLAMVYLVATVLCALLLPRAPAVVASLCCVSALNYFFIPPRYTFEVDGAEYWWILAVLLGLSLALSVLVAGLREGRARAETGEKRAGEVHALSEALAACTSHEQMAQCAAAWLERALGRPCAVFLAGDGQPLRHWGSPEGETQFHAASVHWAMENGRPLGRGCDDWPDLPLWCAPFARRGSTGAVQVLLRSPERPPAETSQHWLALARQVGLCIERERASAAARRAGDEARAEAARHTMLASLSHDLRTPLAGIVGTASALRAQADALPAAQRGRLLENLENEARDLTAMADNVLQLARLSQPQAQLRMEWESIEEVLGATVARMRKRWPAVRFQLRVSPALPPVKAEAALLAQVVANLVDNGVRHSAEPAQIEIAAGRSREGVFVAVRDHGEGLSEGDAASIFERYRPGAHGGGAGLGLAICKLIVQAHGGSIEAHRREPGTEFRIDLPVADVEVAT